jgi:hypothetical protein
MLVMKVVRIGVFPAEAIEKYRRLLAALEELFHVSFEPGSSAKTRCYDAALFFNATRASLTEFPGGALRSLAFVRGPTKLVESSAAAITITSAPGAPRSFWGTTARDCGIVSYRPLALESSDQIIAHSGDDVLWLQNARGRQRLDLVGVEAPCVRASGYLHELFDDRIWFSLLPLLHFTREVSGWSAGEPGGCFIFDDPNLHWTTYGYVDYRDIAADARSLEYHVSFATVPLDSWYTHRPTARLFRENSGQLSLMTHGNNHTRQELHRAIDSTQRKALAAQAFRRARWLQQRTGVHVAAVMAPPHGACSRDMGRALAEVGFEAACISRGSLMSRNPDQIWRASTGLHPTEFHGLPILPRFTIRGNAAMHVRQAMFLGQPVIPMGHHEDLRNGLEPMREVVRIVNAAGGARWQNMTELARSRFQVLRKSEALHVQLYSRCVTLDIPMDVSQVFVAPAWEESPAGNVVVVENGRSHRGTAQESPIRVTPGAKVTITSEPPSRIDANAVNPPRASLRGILRRQLCEARDRLRPAVEPLLSRARSS